MLPAWLISEWTYRASVYAGQVVYLERMIAMVAIVYLTAFLHSRRQVVFGVLFAISAIALIVTTEFLTEGWRDGWPQPHATLPFRFRFGAIALMLLMLALGWMWERRSILPGLAIFVMVFALPWLQTTVHDGTEFTNQDVDAQRAEPLRLRSRRHSSRSCSPPGESAKPPAPSSTTASPSSLSLSAGSTSPASWISSAAHSA